MPHDDFLKVAIAPPKKKPKQRGKRSTGFVLRTTDGTCAMLDFATGNVEVWNVGELPKGWQASNYDLESRTLVERWRGF